MSSVLTLMNKVLMLMNTVLMLLNTVLMLLNTILMLMNSVFDVTEQHFVEINVICFEFSEQCHSCMPYSSVFIEMVFRAIYGPN